MTRETKVGLVVAASFVSLVSVVVWQKMKKSQDDPNPVTIAVAPSTTPPKADPKSGTSTTGVQQATLTIPGSLPAEQGQRWLARSKESISPRTKK